MAEFNKVEAVPEASHFGPKKDSEDAKRAREVMEAMQVNEIIMVNVRELYSDKSYREQKLVAQTYLSRTKTLAKKLAPKQFKICSRHVNVYVTRTA